MRSVTWPFSNLISMRDSAGPWKRIRMRVAVLSSTSTVSSAPGSTAPSDRAVPSQVTVIEPPAELYVFVNGAGPRAANDVDVELDDELDVELDVLLDDVLVAGGLVGLPATTVDAVVVGAAVVDIDEAATVTEV